MNTPTTYPEQFATGDLRDAYAAGWRNGHGIACHNVPKVGDTIDRSVDYVGMGRTVTLDNVRDYHQALCSMAEQNARDFSPFEFLAHDLNEYGEGTEDTPSADEMWEAYENGVDDSIAADLATYTDEDYSNE
jgi:hypothetical protein